MKIKNQYGLPPAMSSLPDVLQFNKMERKMKEASKIRKSDYKTFLKIFKRLPYGFTVDDYLKAVKSSEKK